jgi:CheY-like chemotaxis protein
MNLDFGILWIEDSFSTEEEESLKRRVREAGFIARIHVMENGTGIEKVAHQHSLFHLFDIVLLDYKLCDENGDELAPKIRQLFPSTTILFYSGSLQEVQLRRLIAEKEVEGVFCAMRDQQRFIERTGELIDQTARALDRLSGMRGLAMRVVAECDELMKTAMLSMVGRDKACANKVSDLDAEVFEFLQQQQDRYKKAVAGELSHRFTSRVVDSSKVFSHFRRLTALVVRDPSSFGLDHAQVERLRELRKGSSQYVEQVLNRRNVLGHVAEIAGERGWVLQGSNEISAQDFPDIRRTFALYIDTIREMKRIVVPLEMTANERVRVRTSHGPLSSESDHPEAS